MGNTCSKGLRVRNGTQDECVENYSLCMGARSTFTTRIDLCALFLRGSLYSCNVCFMRGGLFYYRLFVVVKIQASVLNYTWLSFMQCGF